MTTLISLRDPSSFTLGPALADLGGDPNADPFDRERAELKAGDLRTMDFYHWLLNLADEINSALPDYQVRFVHLDTANYLEFIKQDPEEGAFWKELDEERAATP